MLTPPLDNALLSVAKDTMDTHMSATTINVLLLLHKYSLMTQQIYVWLNVLREHMGRQIRENVFKFALLHIIPLQILQTGFAEQVAFLEHLLIHLWELVCLHVRQFLLYSVILPEMFAYLNALMVILLTTPQDLALLAVLMALMQIVQHIDVFGSAQQNLWRLAKISVTPVSQDVQ